MKMKKSVFIRRAALCVALIAILASCEMAGITVNPGNSDSLAVESKGLANSQKTSATSFLVTFDPQGEPSIPAPSWSRTVPCMANCPSRAGWDTHSEDGARNLMAKGT